MVTDYRNLFTNTVHYHLQVEQNYIIFLNFEMKRRCLKMTAVKNMCTEIFGGSNHISVWWWCFKSEIYVWFFFFFPRDMDTGRMYPCHIIPKSPESLCEMKNLQVLNTKPYIINITAINALGSATKTMVFDLEAHGESMIELPSCFFFFYHYA